MPRSCWRLTQPTPHIPPSPICSCNGQGRVRAPQDSRRCSGAHAAARIARSDEPEVWAAHLAVVEGDVFGGLQFETDRARFLGRGRSIRTPVSVIDGQPLSNTSGAVLDPIFSLRRRVRLAPGATAHITFWTLVASSRSEVLDLADKHGNPAAFERLLTLAWTQAQVQLFHLGINADEATMFQRLASGVLYANPALRPSSDVLARSDGGAARAVGLRDFRRPADRRMPDRQHRGPADRPPVTPALMSIGE